MAFLKRKKRSSAKGERRGLPQITASPLFPLPMLCFLFFAEKTILLPAVAAAFLHECGHLAALCLCGGRAVRIVLEPFGVTIVPDERLRTYGEEILISLAGILVNFLCSFLALWRQAPAYVWIFARCSLFLALFNLLPAKGLDGGSALEYLLLRFCSLDGAQKICRAVQIPLCILLSVLLAAGAFLFSFNPTLLLMALYLLFTAF